MKADGMTKSLRERQTSLTKNVIIDAAADLLLGGTPAGEMSMQAIADRAGVSHRTLYRHFGSRTELFGALGARFDAELQQRAGRPTDTATTFDEWIDSVDSLISFAAINSESLRKAYVLAVSAGQWRSDRDEHYWELFRERFPDLPEPEARADYAVLRQLLSGNIILNGGERFDVDLPALTESIRRAVTALAHEIAARNQAAAEGATR
jgi:AcrR family transcriptional regulator